MGGRCAVPRASTSIEAWGMLRAVRRSDASERTVVLPDPMEPVIRSAFIGGIGIWSLAPGILDQSSLRDLSCVFVAYPGLCPGLNSSPSHSGLMSSAGSTEAAAT